MPRPSITMTFDRLTLKLICESRPRLGTFIPPNVGTLGLWVLELFSMYATDEQTDRRTDRRRRTNKSNAYCPPFLYGWGHNKRSSWTMRWIVSYCWLLNVRWVSSIVMVSVRMNLTWTVEVSYTDIRWVVQRGVRWHSYRTCINSFVVHDVRNCN